MNSTLFTTSSCSPTHKVDKSFPLLHSCNPLDYINILVLNNFFLELNQYSCYYTGNISVENFLTDLPFSTIRSIYNSFNVFHQQSTFCRIKKKKKKVENNSKTQLSKPFSIGTNSSVVKVIAPFKALFPLFCWELCLSGD